MLIAHCGGAKCCTQSHHLVADSLGSQGGRGRPPCQEGKVWRGMRAKAYTVGKSTFLQGSCGEYHCHSCSALPRLPRDCTFRGGAWTGGALTISLSGWLQHHTLQLQWPSGSC